MLLIPLFIQNAFWSLDLAPPAFSIKNINTGTIPWAWWNTHQFHIRGEREREREQRVETPKKLFLIKGYWANACHGTCQSQNLAYIWNYHTKKILFSRLAFFLCMFLVAVLDQVDEHYSTVKSSPLASFSLQHKRC